MPMSTGTSGQRAALLATAVARNAIHHEAPLPPKLEATSYRYATHTGPTAASSSSRLQHPHSHATHTLSPAGSTPSPWIDLAEPALTPPAVRAANSTRASALVSPSAVFVYGLGLSGTGGRVYSGSPGSSGTSSRSSSLASSPSPANLMNGHASLYHPSAYPHPHHHHHQRSVPPQVRRNQESRASLPVGHNQLSSRLPSAFVDDDDEDDDAYAVLGASDDAQPRRRAHRVGSTPSLGKTANITSYF